MGQENLLASKSGCPTRQIFRFVKATLKPPLQRNGLDHAHQDISTHECYSKLRGKWNQLRFGRQPKTEVVKPYLLTFNFPTKEVPKALLLSEHSNCFNPSSYISVFYEKDDLAKHKLDFVVCLHQPGNLQRFV